jgi:hypothetical protein
MPLLELFYLPILIHPKFTFIEKIFKLFLGTFPILLKNKHLIAHPQYLTGCRGLAQLGSFLYIIYVDDESPLNQKR